MLKDKLAIYISFFNIIIFYTFSIFIGIGDAQNIFMATFLLSNVIFFFYYRNDIQINSLIFLFVSLLPIINFSKGGFFFYNIITVILSIYNAFILRKKSNYYNVNLIFVSLAFFCVLYYLASFINTGKYNSNLKMFELLLTSCLMPFLWSNKIWFRRAVYMLCFNSILLVFFILRLSNDTSRLMLNSSELLDEGIEIGGNNPIAYGLPIAFCIILVYYFIRFQEKSKISHILLMSSLLFSLFLTTSRGSFLVLIIAFSVFLILEKKLDLVLRWGIVIFCSYFVIYNISNYFDDFRFAFEFLIDRTQSDESLNKISHGRTEQWQAMYEYGKENLLDLVFGFGPGNQYDAHELISMSLKYKADASFQGLRIAFHALPLQLIAEIGILGALVFYFLIIRIFMFNLKVFRKTKNPIFLMCFCAWFAVGLSVSSFDAFSGLFLGMGLVPLFRNYVSK